MNDIEFSLKIEKERAQVEDQSWRNRPSHISMLLGEDRRRCHVDECSLNLVLKAGHNAIIAALHRFESDLGDIAGVFLLPMPTPRRTLSELLL
jgi:hypothetical protein